MSGGRPTESHWKPPTITLVLYYIQTIRHKYEKGIFSDTQSPRLRLTAGEQSQRLSVLALGGVMANDVEGFNFEQRHGKSRVRVARVWKKEEGRYFLVEWNVNISLLSDCVASYVRDDNSDIVATDTMKNTVWFGFTLKSVWLLGN